MADSLKRRYNITALQRGLRLLQLFGELPPGLTAKQVSACSRLPESPVHRSLANLEGAGFLNRGADGVSHLGMACFSIGRAALGQLDVRRVSLPYLQELNRQTRETIHLNARQGLSDVYVEKLESPEPVRVHSRIGAVAPLFCTAVGKVMLAYMPDEDRENVFRQLELKRFTANTVGNLQELKTDSAGCGKTGMPAICRNTNTISVASQPPSGTTQAA